VVDVAQVLVLSDKLSALGHNAQAVLMEHGLDNDSLDMLLTEEPYEAEHPDKGTNEGDVASAAENLEGRMTLSSPGILHRDSYAFVK